MISKNRKRFIISLQRKKVRDEEKLFVIEGDKLVTEFLSLKIPLKTIIGKPEILKTLSPLLADFQGETDEVTDRELKEMSTFATPHNVMAVVPMPDQEFNEAKILNELCVALSFIQDPGNLGTIIRAAGWFGIRNIICSPDCVDLYNPKVIQASMGALLHVNVFYYDLKKLLLSAAEKKIPVFGTMLEGKSIYSHTLDKKGVIIFGNESKGISKELESYITHKIMIPKFGVSKQGIDSLNVGMAASIVLSEFRRR
jgi:RNA methyltransferase, TrmH family